MAPVMSKLKSLETSEQEDACIVAVASLVLRRKQRRRQNRRWWIHPLRQLRQEKGAYSILVEELRFGGENFFRYFRMSREQFVQLLRLIGYDFAYSSALEEA